jgi:type IV secretory pathway VirB4 component
VDSIGYSPNTKYKYLQIVIKLEPDVLKKAEAKGLNINKKNMLVNKELNEQPNIQKSLIDEIAYKPEKEARVIVAQKIRDIETGALVKTGKDSYTIDFDKREKVDKKIEREKYPIEYYFEFLDKIQEILHLATGHELTEDETDYEPNHIADTQRHRFAILNELNENQIYRLLDDLKMLDDLLGSFIHEIDETLNNNKK